MEYKTIIQLLGAAALCGPLVGILLRQFAPSARQELRMDDFLFVCTCETTGMRVSCNGRLVFATGRGADIMRRESVQCSDKHVVIFYQGLFPQLTIDIDGKQLTRWPFGAREWVACFLSGGWMALAMIGMVSVGVSHLALR